MVAWWAWRPAPGDDACPTVNPRVEARLAGQRLVLELASAPASRRCGLSRRDALAPDHGMLFLFPRTGRVSFWMRDTRIPLSLAFLDEEARIIDIQQMQPAQMQAGPLPVFSPPRPVRWALEVNAGWFTGRDIGKGAQLLLSLPPQLVVE